MHPEMMKFCLDVKIQSPQHFEDVFVLDCGSLDVNGNNKYLFPDLRDGVSFYHGIDIAAGWNVDEVCKIHEYEPGQNVIDTILCVEVFEHDEHFLKSTAHMVDILRPGGLLLITCAGPKRNPHSAYLVGQPPDEHEHYENVSEDMLRGTLDPDANFERYEFAYARDMQDLYFWGVKKC